MVFGFGPGLVVPAAVMGLFGRTLTGGLFHRFFHGLFRGFVGFGGLGSGVPAAGLGFVGLFGLPYFLL